MPYRNDEEALLVRVGPGTPSGEVFRRYWLPVEVSTNLVAGAIAGSYNSGKNPIRVRVLGEDLVLFRDASGKPALVAERCSHRGTSLYYGRVEEGALRCPYHGFAYDRAGRCIDTPCEPPGSHFKDTVRHPAYPCVEVAGLIFAYLGPAEKQPPFPRYEALFREDGVRVTGNGGYVQQCNVFQAFHDNSGDPWHREILHQWFRAQPTQSRPMIHYGRDGHPATPVRFEPTPWGVRNVLLMDSERGEHFHYKETHVVWPCARQNIEQGYSMRWAVPLDDAHTRWFQVNFFEYDEHGNVPAAATRFLHDPRPTSARFSCPDDWAEQVGSWWNYGHPWQGTLWEDDVAIGSQGSPERQFLPDWERWHLGVADRGVVLMRDAWREQIRRVQDGLDPVGVVREETDGMIRIPAVELYVTWDDGMALWNMTVDQRLTFDREHPEARRPNARVTVDGAAGSRR
jgi:phenylpropionate dioxygenase-like ring-hydroxylating dioxygenase large terminal subunit